MHATLRPDAPTRPEPRRTATLPIDDFVFSDVFPERRDLPKVRKFMREIATPRYCEQAVNEVLEAIRALGSVQCVLSLDPEHIDLVEGLLLDAPAADWARDEDHMWAVTDANCPCLGCLDEAANLHRVGELVLQGQPYVL